MKKILSFQYKVILAFLLVMNASFVFTGYMVKDLAEEKLLEEKHGKLIALARILDSRLGQGGYAAILASAGAENASRDEKIRILNRALAEATDEVGAAAPKLGVGYYSRELDAILTYGPASLFGDNVGRAIAADHPGRTVMRTNTALVRSGTMVRGDIMNAMLPVARQDGVIGYIWVNELSTDITEQINAMSRDIFGVILLGLGLTVCLLLLLSRRGLLNVNRIISGVRSMRDDISHRIEEPSGEFGEVARSINAMAESIGRANAETGRAIAVLQTVLGNVDAFVYVCEPETKKLVYANEYLRMRLGNENLQGETCHAALYGNDEPCSFCRQKDFFGKDGNPVFTPFYREEHNPRINRDFLVTDRLVNWHDGRLLHMKMGTDVTERKALATAEAANQAQREFLARMSHEIRTPMNGVLGMTRLAMQADPPPAQYAYLKKIHSSAALLLGIINDILDFSRIEAGKLTMEKRAFNLRDMVENIRELIAPKTNEKGLQLTVSLDGSVPEYAFGDELRLSQILLNLLGNAAKFTLNGFVSLRMRAETPAEGTLRIVCSVADSGIGMSEAQRQTLFTRFSQADNSISRQFGGSGLGLSISKALVELMGGRISVTSEAGKGSEFSFTVDLETVREPREEKTSGGKPWECARYDGMPFLLVEDNEINREIAQAILAELGVRVDAAGNGEEAVNAFMGKDYALILMDVRMPVMDGLEATRRIRASGKRDAPTVPIIAMTANAMREDRMASREAGMNGHIAKPIDMDELRREIFAFLHDGSARQSN